MITFNEEILHWIRTGVVASAVALAGCATSDSSVMGSGASVVENSRPPVDDQAERFGHQVIERNPHESRHVNSH